jgi:hypothetical protein
VVTVEDDLPSHHHKEPGQRWQQDSDGSGPKSLRCFNRVKNLSLFATSMGMFMITNRLGSFYALISVAELYHIRATTVHAPGQEIYVKF